MPAGLWDELGSDWLLLDCKIMPWSAKAGALIEGQYGPVADSSKVGLDAAIAALARAAERGIPSDALRDRFINRRRRAEAYVRA
jgi:protein phosphatase